MIKQAEKKCAICRTKRPIAEMYKPPASFRFICKPHISLDCTIQLSKKLKLKKQKAEERKSRAETKRRRVNARSRLEWYDMLNRLVNQYYKSVLAKGEPCYTCGKKQRFEDKPGAFHAGHYMPGKRVDPRRFLLENRRIQCYRCNCSLSGNQAVYKQRITEEKGEEFVNWLECEANFKPLKEQYPDIADIESEIARYRKLLREAGVRPSV